MKRFFFMRAWIAVLFTLFLISRTHEEKSHPPPFRRAPIANQPLENREGKTLFPLPLHAQEEGKLGGGKLRRLPAAIETPEQVREGFTLERAGVPIDPQEGICIALQRVIMEGEEVKDIKA